MNIYVFTKVRITVFNILTYARNLNLILYYDLSTCTHRTHRKGTSNITPVVYVVLQESCKLINMNMYLSWKNVLYDVICKSYKPHVLCSYI